MLYVVKNPRPGTLADVREAVGEIRPGEELMSEAEYQTWLDSQTAAQRTEAAADITEGEQLVALWEKFQDGTVTNAEQRRVLKWLFRQELKKRGLL